jgi:alkanesulfonate monooxygenase SsuD/methylene tetrahydromethanopterin reductase-like flavin-dependent oxidoreductase (luciferase family)
MHESPAPRRLAIGLRPPQSMFEAGAERLAELVARAERRGIDHLCSGDHVAFRGGRGFDGLLQVGALAVLSRLPVHSTVYLLPLRHPFAVARQVATLAGLAPGRISLGVGVGGEDRRELENCGVDPATRGRRMDECLALLSRLLAGETLDFQGEFFRLREARILPVPDPPVPILVGGRSQAALRRAGRMGQGWHAVFVSPERFARASAEVEAIAREAGRTGVDWRHGIQVWCGFDRSRAAALPRLAQALEEFYALPFDSFARYAPAGTPAEVAAALAPYRDAGCTNLNLIPIAPDPEQAIDAVAEVRSRLVPER